MSKEEERIKEYSKDFHEEIHSSAIGQESMREETFTAKMGEILDDNGETEDIHILSPGFSVDCLETIEEIGEENRDYFMKAGGNSYHYIKCLNDSKNHINMISAIIKKHSQGWKV